MYMWFLLAGFPTTTTSVFFQTVFCLKPKQYYDPSSVFPTSSRKLILKNLNSPWSLLHLHPSRLSTSLLHPVCTPFLSLCFEECFSPACSISHLAPVSDHEALTAATPHTPQHQTGIMEVPLVHTVGHYKPSCSTACCLLQCCSWPTLRISYL